MTDPDRDGGLEPDGLYHLSTQEDWVRSRELGRIEPPSLESEGFVHCSWGRQVSGTVAKHFAGVPEILGLRLDPGKLGDLRLIEEDRSGSGQEFPHVYGPIPSRAVVDVVVIR